MMLFVPLSEPDDASFILIALHEISQTGMSSFGTHLLNYFESHKN